MPNRRISELPEATSLTGSEILPITQNGLTKRANPNLIIALVTLESLGAASETHASSHGPSGSDPIAELDYAQLPAADTLTDQDIIPGLQDGLAVKITLADIMTAVSTALQGRLLPDPGNLPDGTLMQVIDGEWVTL